MNLRCIDERIYNIIRHTCIVCKRHTVCERHTCIVCDRHIHVVCEQYIHCSILIWTVYDGFLNTIIYC